MRNKFNRCCCTDEPLPVDCIICQSVVGCPTNQVEGTNNFFILQNEYPDWGPGFVSRGRLAGTMGLGNQEDEFRVLFDYVDRSNYFSVSFKIDGSVTALPNQQLLIIVRRRAGGVTTEIGRRVVLLTLDATLHSAAWCVSWDADTIYAHVLYLGFTGGSYETAKTGNNESGLAGYATFGSFAGGDITSYTRLHDETDTGLCGPCPPISPATPTLCCPDGIAAAWLVDFNLLALTDNYFSMCSALNGNTYILDRQPGQGLATYQEVFRLAYSDTGCFGPFDVRVTIEMNVFTVEDNCTIQLLVVTAPFSAGQVCLNAGTLLVYEKNGLAIGEACSGTHTLNLAFSDLGALKQCSGTAPATINVVSL